MVEKKVSRAALPIRRLTKTYTEGVVEVGHGDVCPGELAAGKVLAAVLVEQPLQVGQGGGQGLRLELFAHLLFLFLVLLHEDGDHLVEDVREGVDDHVGLGGGPVVLPGQVEPLG